jgi:hypothetical protein
MVTGPIPEAALLALLNRLGPSEDASRTHRGLAGTVRVIEFVIGRSTLMESARSASRRFSVDDRRLDAIAGVPAR